MHTLSLLALATSTAAFGQSALYYAGTAGNPAVAPDPVSQGWTLVDPSGGVVAVAPISPDPGTGRNAWQVDDQATFNGGRAHYAQYFATGELATAADLGWELTLDARFLASAGVDLFSEFATGTTAADDRYLLFYEVAGPDVTVSAFLTGGSFVCTNGNDGSYHTYTIRKPAGAGVLDTEFLFDGVVLGVLPRAASNGNAAPGGVHWGSGSSGATGTANFHRVEFGLLGPAPLGTAYCTAAANSTGSPASLGAIGSAVAAQNNVTLTCTQMPPNAFSFFLTSATQGFVASPGGSQGNLCLGGSIGRYVAQGQIQNSGAAGAVALALDLTQHPTPNGLIHVVAGQRWNFQCWYRDANPTVTSNFSSGLQIDFL